ncbi:Solute carrier family 25 member [Nesidiocoris tenuis]|uniref:Mitochondrial glycine transporter n=1 Tax=Nesidiocoris tenuis TaxID=355587 RepID=A0ABN7BBY4_9HEMI|nr:Solute carrier family 25 member [Nesidiocoris tenuis]
MFIPENPVLKAFLAGSISGTCSTVLFQPLDLVKTRLQNAPVASHGSNTQLGMLNLFSNIVRKEHASGLWKGITPSLARTVPGVGLYFASMHWMTSALADGHPSPLQAVAIGMVGRTFSVVSLIPITVIKTRFESGNFQYGSMGGALRQIWKAEGVKGLTCGLLPTLIRDAPFSGIYLMFYTKLKSSLPNELVKGELQAPVQFSCGVTAGILASVLTQPADVIKTKMQLYPDNYPNIRSVVFHLHEKYGMTGYFKGLLPRTLRRTLMASMAWTVYEQATRAMGLK